MHTDDKACVWASLLYLPRSWALRLAQAIFPAVPPLAGVPTASWHWGLTGHFRKQGPESCHWENSGLSRRQEGLAGFFLSLETVTWEAVIGPGALKALIGDIFVKCSRLPRDLRWLASLPLQPGTGFQVCQVLRMPRLCLGHFRLQETQTSDHHLKAGIRGVPLWLMLGLFTELTPGSQRQFCL